MGLYKKHNRMGLKQILRDEAHIMTGKSFVIPYNFEDKTALPKGKKIEDEIIITPITVRTWFKIKPLLMSIDSKDLNNIIYKEGEILNSDCIEIMAKYDKEILDIIWYGIHNKSSDPQDWFRQLLIDNSTWQDLAVVFNAILIRLNSLSFYNTITIAKNVSPLREREIIALQKNSLSWMAPQVMLS